MAQLFAVKRQEQLYTPEEMEHYRRSKYAKKYIDRKATASQGTAMHYGTQVAAFSQFVFKNHQQMELDDFIDAIKSGRINAYDALADFAAFVKRERVGDKKIKANTLSKMVRVTKRFLKFCGCAINNEDFKEQVSLPRNEVIEKKAADKQDLIIILNAAQNVRLKTYLMFEAVYGPRPMEACALRHRDVDLEAETVTFRPEFSKMRVARTRRMTKELVRQTKVWLAEKYRPYRTTLHGKHIWITPNPKPDDLLFAPYHNDGVVPKPRTLYVKLSTEFKNLLGATNMDKWEENGRRRELTQYSFRRFAKTQLSDLGFGDYSEWWIGHSGSTYYRKSEREREEMFQRLEPYMTFLDAASLQAHATDVEAKMEEMEKRLFKGHWFLETTQCVVAGPSG